MVYFIERVPGGAEIDELYGISDGRLFKSVYDLDDSYLIHYENSETDQDGLMEITHDGEYFDYSSVAKRNTQFGVFGDLVINGELAYVYHRSRSSIDKKFSESLFEVNHKTKTIEKMKDVNSESSIHLDGLRMSGSELLSISRSKKLKRYQIHSAINDEEAPILETKKNILDYEIYKDFLFADLGRRVYRPSVPRKVRQRSYSLLRKDLTTGLETELKNLPEGAFITNIGGNVFLHDFEDIYLFTAEDEMINITQGLDESKSIDLTTLSYKKKDDSAEIFFYVCDSSNIELDYDDIPECRGRSRLHLLEVQTAMN